MFEMCEPHLTNMLGKRSLRHLADFPPYKIITEKLDCKSPAKKVCCHHFYLTVFSLFFFHLVGEKQC
jgi:hypothetical protein